jgi:NADH:ubiquinone oxidoreductase subunit 6 (subunit J)
MEETKQTWIEDIKKGWEQIPNSVKFWNGLVLLGLVISGLVSLELLWVELAIMTFLAFAVCLDSIGEEGKLDKHLWVWFTPLMWCLVVFALIVYGCIKLYENTISKFNDWLDK